MPNSHRSGFSQILSTKGLHTMSYILDALRKADAERDNGSVPDIYSQSVLLSSKTQTTTQYPVMRTGLWIFAALGVITVAALAIWLVMRPVVSATSSPTPMPDMVANLPAAERTAAPAAAATAGVDSAPVPSGSVQGRPTPDAQPRASIAKSANPANPAAPPATGGATAQPRTTDPTPAATPGTEANNKSIYTLNELPENIRSQLPALNIGGSMYSDVAANRVLIINNQALREGEQVSNDLVLEHIKLKSAVLSYKGYRYSITY
jgi:general secretion pathway protein B